MLLAQIVNPQFREVLLKLSKEKLPLKTAFKLKTILKKIDQEFLKYEEIRVEVVKKYGEKNDKGELITDNQGNVSIAKENLQIFVKELEELTSLELEIDSITIAELGDNITLSAEDLSILDTIII